MKELGETCKRIKEEEEGEMLDKDGVSGKVLPQPDPRGISEVSPQRSPATSKGPGLMHKHIIQTLGGHYSAGKGCAWSPRCLQGKGSHRSRSFSGKGTDMSGK